MGWSWLAFCVGGLAGLTIGAIIVIVTFIVLMMP